MPVTVLTPDEIRGRLAKMDRSDIIKLAERAQVHENTLRRLTGVGSEHRTPSFDTVYRVTLALKQ